MTHEPDILYENSPSIVRREQVGETLLGRMMIYDAQYADVRTINVACRADCGVCGT